MPKKFFPIGTATTPRKQAAIAKVKSGLLDTSSYEYAKGKWRASLFNALRKAIPSKWFNNEDVWDFAEECVDDAFTRIKEYDEKHRFRDFLVAKIVLPAYEELLRKHRQRLAGEKSYTENQPKKVHISAKNLIDDIKPSMERELAKDVLRKLKAEDEMKYEVFCYREFDEWEYKDIADEWGISEANARQIYGRVKKEIIPELFDRISQSNKYLDKDLKIKNDILKLLKKEIKGK
ncbi:MAG: sigma-70 family RNA polymerase sigma factor [Planctomycetota bacterium]